MKIWKIGAGAVLAASLLTLAGPVVGEMVATLPPRFSGATPNLLDALDLSYEEVEFPTTEGLTLRGWFVPAERRSRFAAQHSRLTPGQRAPAILYAPATSHDQRSGLTLVPAFHAAGYHVLLFSYRGHGDSDGSRLGFTYGDAESRDVDAAVRFLRRQPDMGPIVALGHSAGAVSAMLSAARTPEIDAVVAIAPFASMTEIWHTSRPSLVPAFVLDWTMRFAELRKGFDRQDACAVDTIERIAPRPLLIIHGAEDQRVTQTQAKRLWAAAGEPKTLWLVEGATHDSIRGLVQDQLAPDLIAFLDAALRD